MDRPRNVGAEAYTVYRQLAAETTSSSEEETSKPTGTTSTTSSAEATSDPQNDGDDDSNDEDPLEDGEETSSGGSNAWIAGAVIGPLAAVCAAVAAFVWMRKRKGAQQSARAGALEDGSAPKDGPEPPPVYMLHTNEKPIELPTEQQFVAELPASTRY
ncbi:unnamed protein product [Parascedosporium putredinis]|uniref:Uncharacterized protein n=1 Tax=Parascedosporium putredinis TaxID=1442378 RepID=A0A9P1H9G9_9PEZI|nr:unnamed protein product [Parascedosporium putredinis]CAI8001730.1 unnamed protein product [Parascedosporium putredinis]